MLCLAGCLPPVSKFRPLYAPKFPVRKPVTWQLARPRAPVPKTTGRRLSLPAVHHKAARRCSGRQFRLSVCPAPRLGLVLRHRCRLPAIHLRQAPSALPEAAGLLKWVHRVWVVGSWPQGQQAVGSWRSTLVRAALHCRALLPPWRGVFPVPHAAFSLVRLGRHVHCQWLPGSVAGQPPTSSSCPQRTAARCCAVGIVPATTRQAATCAVIHRTAAAAAAGAAAATARKLA